MNADLSVAAITDGILHYGSPSHRESSGLMGAGAAGAAPAWLLQPCCPADGTACPGSALRRSLPPFANLVQTLCGRPCRPQQGQRCGQHAVCWGGFSSNSNRARAMAACAWRGRVMPISLGRCLIKQNYHLHLLFLPKTWLAPNTLLWKNWDWSDLNRP